MAAKALHFDESPATTSTSAWCGLRGNVFVDPEHIVRVPLHLDLDQTLVVITICGMNPLVPFFLCEEIDIGAARRKPADISPRSPCPLDIHLIVVRCLPGRGDVDNGAGVAVSDCGVALRQVIECAVDREKNDRGMR